MALMQSKVPFHWAYFLALEDDLLALSRYVEIVPDNYGTYSIEISRLLQSACSEIDSVLKQISLRQMGIDPDDAQREPSRNDPSTISAYYPLVIGLAPHFNSFRVEIPRMGLELQPWDTWAAAQAPYWWTAHNRLKHGRHQAFQQATLQHCVNALAGLLIAVVHLHWEEARDGLPGIPSLFSIPAPIGAQRWGARGHSQIFYLRPEDNPMHPDHVPRI